MAHERPIRVILTAWYSVVVATGLLVFAALIWWALSYSFQREGEASLLDRMKGLERYLVLESEDNLPHLGEELDEYSRSLPADHLMEVTDQSGHTIASSGPALHQFLKADAFSQQSAFVKFRWKGEPYRMLAETFRDRDHSYRMYLAVSTASAERVLGQVLFMLLAALPLTLAFAVVGGLWLSRRALAPVDRMTATVRSISFENLSAGIDVPSTQIYVPSTNDELQRLAETWNSLLERLGDSVARMTRFTGDASHELRTPVALIRTTAELALRRTRSAESYREALQQIRSEAERMTELLDDLLFLARADAGNTLRPDLRFPLDSVARDAVDQVRPMAEEKGVSLTMADTAAAATRICGDENAIRRLALALLVNAIKYTPRDGHVWSEVGVRNGKPYLSVSDSGVGIDSEALPHIFERFYRADPARSPNESGYGLGLSIAEAIARQHRARIEVHSEPGNTRFTVCFEAPTAEWPRSLAGDQCAPASSASG